MNSVVDNAYSILNSNTKTNKDQVYSIRSIQNLARTEQELITGLCFTALNEISTAQMTGDHKAAEYNRFDDLPSEIIEVIGSYLYEPRDIAVFCQTCRRIRAIMIDKLRLYDPTIKIGTSEVDHLLRKWKIPKFELKRDTCYHMLKDKHREGFYFDPNELWQWALYNRSAGMYTICKIKELFLRHLKANDFDPSAHGNFAIRGASYHGYLEIVKLLLADDRVDPSTKDNFAIQWASCDVRLEIVRLLLEDKRVDPSAGDNNAIKWASRFGKLEVVQLLLADKRVDPSADQDYAFNWASENGHSEIVRLLLADQRVDPSGHRNYAIRSASENGHSNVVECLLATERVDPSDDDNWAIRMASERGHLEVVELLLADKRVDPSAEDNYAIIFASEKGHLEVVKRLLADERVDPSAVDNLAIAKASAHGHLEIVQLLLSDERVHPSSDNNKAIIKASENGHLEVVKLLLTHPRLRLEQKDILEIRNNWSINQMKELLRIYESRHSMETVKKNLNKRKRKVG